MGCSISKPNNLGTLTSEIPEDYGDHQFIVKVLNLTNVPGKDFISESDTYVLFLSGKKRLCRTSTKWNDASPTFDEILDLTGVSLNDEITIQVWDYDRFKFNDFIGEAKLFVRDIVKRPKLDILLSEKNGDFVVRKSTYAPMELSLQIIRTPKDWPVPAPNIFSESVSTKNEDGSTTRRKHVMLLTRGTRGDVQPFVALARGLANLYGYVVTVCTELRYKEFVKNQGKDLERGRIRFRPSGGDTHARIESSLAQWAMQNPSEVLQIAMLARSEREFFSSEPIAFYWAQKLMPDYLIYGFTMVSIAMIISEKLRIPICGFVLQPSVIPSSEYDAVVPISTHFFSFIDKMEESLTGHSTQLKLKAWMENDPFYRPLNRMRERRGLKPFSSSTSETWNIILQQQSPVVVPIAEAAFGGRPRDWSEAVTFTDFIFLRGNRIPKLTQDLIHFIQNAKKANEPLVLMAFSSMPVSRRVILRDALHIIKECKCKPRVIALSGPKMSQKLGMKINKQVKNAKQKDKLFEDSGADFGLLFEHLDCAVIHGGLGTTAEAMRRGIPTMVCGVLLMDQRFWGKQCEKLGIGPEMCHITQFHRCCVERIDSMLSKDSPYLSKARELSKQLGHSSNDGIQVNTDTIVSKLETASPIEYSLHE